MTFAELKAHIVAHLFAYLAANLTVLALAVYGWVNNWWSAFTASLPDPDNPNDWPFSPYRLFFKTVRQQGNQKSHTPPPTEDVTLPK